MYARLFLLLGIILAVGFAPAPLPRREREIPKATIDRMQGWWMIVQERSGGQPGRDASSGLRLLVKGDTLRYYVGERPADGWTITVNDGIRPPGLDKMNLGATRGIKPSYLCRISVEGDILKIAWLSSDERPTDLSGNRGVAITFRRAPK